jgi:hypothetical protein
MLEGMEPVQPKPLRMAQPSRKALMERIGTLGTTEHAEIFRILKRHSIPHTQNKNGIFINVTSVPDEVVKEVADFVAFCFHNNKELEEYEKNLNQCKLYQNLDCLQGDAQGQSSESTSARKNRNQRLALNLNHPGKPGSTDGIQATSSLHAKIAALTSTTTLPALVEILEGRMEFLAGQRIQLGSSKYAAARKRLSKRVVVDVKISKVEEACPDAELKPEAFLIPSNAT